MSFELVSKPRLRLNDFLLVVVVVAFPIVASQGTGHHQGGTAVLVEPRVMPELVGVIHSVAALLNSHPGWSIVFYHGSANKAWAQKTFATVPRLTLQSLDLFDWSLAVKDISIHFPLRYYLLQRTSHNRPPSVLC